MHLDLSSLEKATASLRQTLGVATDMAKARPDDAALHNALRAGVVQAFEFTYELSWKFMKRWIEDNMGASQVDGVPRRELFRLAAESRLVDDVGLWMSFHSARNQTSHTYESSIAREVAAMAPALLIESEKLLASLRDRND